VKKFVLLFGILAAVSFVFFTNYYNKKSETDLTEKIMNSDYASEFTELNKKNNALYIQLNSGNKN
jgi:hypothetical protein